MMGKNEQYKEKFIKKKNIEIKPKFYEICFKMFWYIRNKYKKKNIGIINRTDA